MEGRHIEDIAELVLEKASKLGASYCEARTEALTNETINVEGSLLKSSYNYFATGTGIRVIAGGAWGFSSATSLDAPSVEDAVTAAVRIGKAAGSRRKKPVMLRKVKPVREDVATNVEEEFGNISLKEKVESLVECNKRLKASDDVMKTVATLVLVQSQKFIATSEGSKVRFKHSMAFGSMSAFASSSGVSEAASVEFGGSGGYEMVEPSCLIELSQDVGQRVTRLLKAKACPNMGRTQVIMDPTYVALLVHEIIGHPSEADRVLGWENAWGGGAWWQGMLGQQVGSRVLNAVDEGSVKGALGYTPYDDEAVRCDRNYLIKEGKLVGHIQSRQTAEEFGTDAKGGVRSFSFCNAPLIRMTNTYILGGDWSEEEILEETKSGILVQHYVAPSIDDRRYRWAVTPQEAFLVENGEVTESYRGAVVMGVAPEFFKSIDAVGRDVSILPLAGCGKGDPEQLICVGNGGPTLRGTASVVGRGE
ncbi:MAG: TldD/PmbA family protein [Promethearchaeati archaeon SRVP18_Atabeyarchaeia-1]